MIPNLEKPSMFTGEGEIRPSASGNGNNGGGMQVGAYVDLSRVKWPEAEGFGADHARHMSQLAKHLAIIKNGGLTVTLSATDSKILDAAAVLHGIGASEAGAEPARSASMAVQLLTAPGNDWLLDEAEAVARLIYRQNDREAAASDQMLRVLQDAIRLEEARFKNKGLGHIRAVWQESLFWFAWSKDPGTMKTWLRFHKWL